MTTRGIAYAPFWRVVSGVLVAISRGGLLVMVVAMWFFETRLDNPLRLIRTFVVVSLAPGIAAWLMARAFGAVITIEAGVLAVQRRDRRIEVPCESVARIVPWQIPVPTNGMTLVLRSGRSFPYGLAVADPIALIDAIADAGASEAVRAAACDWSAIYGRSRRGSRAPWQRWIDAPFFKFGVVALVPTLPLFRLHQWIAYGGTFGEYYTYGLQAYVLGFAVFWATFVVDLVLYAAILRAAAELAMLAVARVAPERVGKARAIAETTHWILYLGGIAAFLIRLALLA
jgi:apolipoprotein N-acyltransferase